MKKLKVLGLGRCIIGHLAKALNKEFSEQVSLTHHYVLNFESCLNSSFDTKSLKQFSHISCSPSIEDQLLCLGNLLEFDVCAIEIFPPARLYQKESLLCCFEDFSNELHEAGFRSTERPESDYNENYFKILEQLIVKVQQHNPTIKIVLVNGEIADVEQQIGSLRLANLMHSVLNSSILNCDEIAILDMNSLVDKLTNKAIASYESAFPHIYIRHNPNLEFIQVSRDTKHATPYVRRLFLQAFCQHLQNFKLNAPTIEIETPQLDYFADTIEQRADNFLTLYNTDSSLLETLQTNSKFFSQYISYAVIKNEKTTQRSMQDFIDLFSKSKLSPELLKDYFYHIRTLCAYSASIEGNIIPSLLSLGNQITQFTKNEFAHYTNFGLLWIKNIYLAYSLNFQQENSAQIESFIQALKSNDYLLTFNEVQHIINCTELLIDSRT